MAKTNIPPWLWIAAGVALLATLGAGTGAAVVAVLEYWQRSDNAQKWLPTLQAAELTYGLPANLLGRIAYEESSYRQSVIDGTQPSSAGALGLMQLMPQYFMTVRRPIPFTDQDTTDQINEAAAQVATLYGQLAPLAASTGQNPWALVLAGYNAGAQAVKNAGGIPQNTQTPGYVADILADVPAANV